MHFKRNTLATTILIVYFYIFRVINCLSVADENRVHSEKQDEQHRSKRYIFLRTAGMGYITAVAIPTPGLPFQRLFLAFNFEAHYGLADADTFSYAQLSTKDTVFFGNKKKRDVHGIPTNNRLEHFTDKKNIYTRKNFYRILEGHISSVGYNGTSCLLRLICETSENPFYEYNGVFGNIFHILFSPSSSKHENIKEIYYTAEYDGQQNNCQRYYDHCTVSLLDLVSKFVSIKLRNMF